jgi:hypothetical protein
MRAENVALIPSCPELPGFIPPEGRTPDHYHFISNLYFKDSEVDVIETLRVLQRSVRSLIEELDYGALLN